MKNKFLLLFLSSIMLICANVVFASNIMIIPDSTTGKVGDVIGLSVIIDTQNKSINNAEGIITFPKDLIEVVSAGKTGSIFSFWMEEPKFSNSLGQITFNGGIPNPGYKGTKGLVAKIGIRAIKSGSALISFSSANIRLNDGLGTDDTNNKVGTTIVIRNAGITALPETAPIVSPVVSPVVNPIDDLVNNPVQDVSIPDELVTVPNNAKRYIPEITSTDAPDENAWYSKSAVTFSWNIPSGVDGVQLLYGKKANSIPGISYIPAISKKTIDELNDGTYYFHARFRDAYGWGETVHRKINIDKTKPENLYVSYVITDDNLVSLDIFGQDKVSGIKKYGVILDGSDKEIEVNISNSADKGKIILPPIKSGEQKLLVRAYDKADNYSEKEINVLVPEMKVPEIITYPEKINSKDNHNIVGKAYYANAKVQIWINDKMIHEVPTKEDGTFSCDCNMESCPDYRQFVSNLSASQNNGDISLNIKVKTIRADGVESEFSKVVNSTLQTSVFPKFKFQLPILANINYLVIGLFVLVFIILGFLYYDLHKVKSTKRILNRDFQETEVEVKRILEVIQNELRNSSRLLKKASAKKQQTVDLASKEEYKILEQLAKNIDVAEKYFSEKMKNIATRD